MSPLTGSIVSLIFLALGMILVLIMLNLQGNPKERPRGLLLRKIHRFLGYLFVLTYLVILAGMILKVSGAAGEFSPRVVIHLTLALLLFPLLLIKVLIVRSYKRLYSHLVSLGLIIFFISFVMVMISAGYFLLHANPPAGNAALQTTEQTNISEQEKLKKLFIEGKDILAKKCSLCHNHDRINQAKKNQQNWKNTLERMVKYSRNPQYLTKTESATLINYLSTREPTPPLKPGENQR